MSYDNSVSDVVDLLNLHDESDGDAKSSETLKSDRDEYILEQYPYSILEFSSQYGSDYSISYTASNLIGKYTKYPEYGDFPETYAMRTYGQWWEKAPSATNEFQQQNLPKIPSHDFIVLGFENYTIPEEITIFETFNPGACIRIYGYTIVKTWVCLYEASATDLIPIIPSQSRAFKPPLKKTRFPIRVVRLEFNHSFINYLTQIDGCLLVGRNVNVRFLEESIRHYEAHKRAKGSILGALSSIRFKPSENKNAWHQFLQNDLERFVNKEVHQPSSPCSEELPMQLKMDEQIDICLESQKSYLNITEMPFDIVLKIFSYLDLVSLFRVGQVCHFFFEISLSSSLYMELNLKPYWHLTTNELLGVLAKRATVLKKLDLSWCGFFNTISPTEFKKFIQQRGDTLTHLRLQSCQFLNATCIESVGIVCDNLKELSLRNCSTDPPLLNFSCLANLKNLERLDLLKTLIEPELLLTMLEANRKLKHLNLAFSGVAVNMDDVAKHIGAFNQQLVSLDIWKSHFLTAIGLKALSHCHDLEEIDVGWCLREASLGDSLKNLLMNCPKLKKLFMSACRGITDGDVIYIANYSEHLEQLDLMGVIGITKQCYNELFSKCKKLQLLDLSFCDNVFETDKEIWNTTFPNVDIKCSHLSATG